MTDVSVSVLQPHPKNAAIYGSEDVTSLTERIRKSDWIKPLVVTPEHRIISGHRRWEAARRLQLATVPVEYRSFANEEDEIEALLLENENRDKTPEQKIREAEAWEEIEREKAKRRRLATLKQGDNTPVCLNSDTREDKGRSDQKAAAKAGLKRDTYNKGKVVLAKADELRANGDEDTAQQLIDTLNKQSVDRAYKQVAKIEAAAQTMQAVAAISAPIDTRKAVNDGDVWQLGRHTLFCGDTSSGAFRSLLDDNAAFAFADPPYNAGVDAWDKDFTWQHDYLYDCAPIVAVTPGIASIFDFARITKMPYRWSMACWIDNGMTRGAMGYGNWIYVALFGDDLYQQAQDIHRVSIDVSTTHESAHRGRKPLDLIVHLINLYSSRNDVVIDPFLGSGTTLIAAEETGRVCIGGEINPDYCSDIIARWEARTGMEATRQ